jgi:hypothetical protein
MPLTVLAALVAFALMGCAPPATVVSAKLNHEYKSGTFSGRTLHMLPIANLYIENRDDYEDDLGVKSGGTGSPSQSVIGNMIFTNLVRNTPMVKAVFDSALVESGEAWQDTLIPFTQGGRTVELHFRFPNQAQSRVAGMGSDLVLVFNGVGFARETSSFIAGYGPGAQPTRSLNFVGCFLLWDHAKGTAAAYGRFRSASKFGYAMSRGNWEGAIENAIGALVKNSGLLK